MSISAEKVAFDDDRMWVHLIDGRVLGVPLAWFPKLLSASEEQLEQVQISAFGLHWEGIDEDISLPALLSQQMDNAA